MKPIEMLAAAKQGIIKWWAGFGTARKIILIVGSSVIAIVTGINEVLSLYDRITDKTNKTVERELVRTLSTNETGFVSSKPFELSLSTNLVAKASGDVASLHFIVREMVDSHQAGHYYEAINYAHTAETLLANCDTQDPLVLSDHVAIKSCLMEENFYNKNYDRVIELHKEMQTLGKNRYVATRPCFMALESIARLLKEGKSLFFFSPSDLGEFRSWNKEMLEEYFGYLAAWGYVQPITIDPRQKNHVTFYYEDFFGFSKPLPYLSSFTLSAHLTNNVVLTSNEMSARWAGRKKFVPVDVDKCVGDELCLMDEERNRKPLKMALRFDENKPERVSVDFYPKEGLGLSPDTPITVKTRSAWSSGLTLSSMKEQIVCVGQVRTQKVVEYRVPIQVGLIIITLIAMAFASPTQTSSCDNPESPKDKNGNDEHPSPARHEPLSGYCAVKDFLLRLKYRLRMTKLSIAVEVAILVPCLSFIVYFTFADKNLAWAKECHDICLNIAAATIFALIVENITMRMSKRQTAAAILRADACIRNFISRFSKLYLELTYEDKNQFMADVKTIDFTKRGGVDSILLRRINGRAMASIFLPSMIIGSGYKTSAVVAFIAAEKSMITAFLQMSQTIDFSYWPEIFKALHIIIHASSIVDCQTEMTELAKMFNHDDKYRNLLTQWLTDGTFDNSIATGNIPSGNILTPYVVFYKHTEWLATTLCDYENKVDSIRNRFPDLVIT